MFERTYAGLDVHARSVMASAVNGESGEIRTVRLVSQTDAVLAWVASLPGPVAVAYEAGPTGFGLARALTAAGIRCVVVAPSKVERPLYVPHAAAGAAVRAPAANPRGKDHARIWTPRGDVPSDRT